MGDSSQWLDAEVEGHVAAQSLCGVAPGSGQGCDPSVQVVPPLLAEIQILGKGASGGV